ncbi:MAG: 3-isopropylmalate dehydrogenase [Gammaproteobacteria bacterium]|nr:3-isopropylmalate dehydrogenase [Gammaproteobacteria bacterium]
MNAQNESRKKKLLFLPGDGVGPEIVEQAERILNVVKEQFELDIEVEHDDVGGVAIDKFGLPLTEEILNKAQRADAVLLGAVGGPQWEHLDISVRPEKALLTLRSQLSLFANFRPAILSKHLKQASSLKPELVENLDILILRELTGGIYFGQPRGVSKVNGLREGINTYRYNESEIKRIAHVAFKAARQRNKKLCSVDKANVLEVTELWREVVNEVSVDYPDVELSHMYVDNAAMQLVRNPKQFDVIVTGNMFGDILSDIAAMLTGSIGMLPSASLNSKQQGMYEPVHGSAPDIAGKNIANPIATVLSLAMLFRFSLNREDIALLIESAVNKTLSKGYRTQDIASEATDKNKVVGTKEMGDAILQSLNGLLGEHPLTVNHHSNNKVVGFK